MPALAPLESFDLIIYSAQLQDRLSAALVTLTKKQGLKREKEWLSASVELLQASREGTEDLVERSLGLSELSGVREEHAVQLQGKWVDALERLLAGITFHAGSRAPLIEALFPRQKLPALRRAKREVVEAYQAELEKRIGGGYVKRMISQEAFAFALPVIEEVRTAFAPWKAAFAGEELPEEQATQLRGQLASLAKKLETPIQQAKLLAEAALWPVSGLYEAAGIGSKPRKHSVKAVPVEEAPANASSDAEPEAAEGEISKAVDKPSDAPSPAASGAGATGKPPRKRRSKPAAAAAPEPA